MHNRFTLESLISYHWDRNQTDIETFSLFRPRLCTIIISYFHIAIKCSVAKIPIHTIMTYGVETPEDHTKTHFRWIPSSNILSRFDCWLLNEIPVVPQITATRYAKIDLTLGWMWLRPTITPKAQTCTSTRIRRCHSNLLYLFCHYYATPECWTEWNLNRHIDG